MGVELRLPNIHGSDREQLVQMRGYLYQLVGELQWALNNVTPTSESVVIQTKGGGTVLPPASSSTEIETTFGALKPLIIKSAEIVQAYYEEIDNLLKLSGDYVAQSDFGTYKEETALLIKANSTSITQQYSNIQTITTNIGTITTNLGTVTNELGALGGGVDALDGEVSDLDENLNTATKGLQKEIGDANTKIGEVNEGWKAADETNKTNLEANTKTLSDGIGDVDKKASGINEATEGLKGDIADLKKQVASVIETTAAIKSGHLYDGDNGMPVYGIEIFQKDETTGYINQRFARFTADRLSFYDSGGIEVAYISNQKLYISDVEITASAKLGGFILNLSKGLRLKWEGREKG